MDIWKEERHDEKYISTKSSLDSFTNFDKYNFPIDFSFIFGTTIKSFFTLTRIIEVSSWYWGTLHFKGIVRFHSWKFLKMWKPFFNGIKYFVCDGNINKIAIIYRKLMEAILWNYNNVAKLVQRIKTFYFKRIWFLPYRKYFEEILFDVSDMQ